MDENRPVEPEILPPEPSGGRRRGAGQHEPGTERVRIVLGRGNAGAFGLVAPSPLSMLAAGLVLGAIVAGVVFLLLGAVLVSLPVLAVLAAGGLIAGLLRRRVR